MGALASCAILKKPLKPMATDRIVIKKRSAQYRAMIPVIPAIIVSVIVELYHYGPFRL